MADTGWITFVSVSEQEPDDKVWKSPDCGCLYSGILLHTPGEKEGENDVKQSTIPYPPKETEK